jgi:hypothetical protein
MTQRIAIKILPRDFEAFKKIMPDEPRLGADYREWRRAATESASDKAVTVYPEEFRLYCVQIGQFPSYFVLEAFAVKKGKDTA